jgi:hypothetical protein
MHYCSFYHGKLLQTQLFLMVFLVVFGTLKIIHIWTFEYNLLHRNRLYMEK